MPDQDAPIGDLRTDDELAEDELKILEEANRLAESAEESQEQFQEEIERIEKEHPNLVFEPNPNLIGTGVEVSPDVLEWAHAYGIMNKLPHKKTRPTKKNTTQAERTKKRKAQRKARRKGRK